MSVGSNPADHAALGAIIGSGTVQVGAGAAAGELVARGPYGQIPDGPNVGPGRPYTASEKAQIYEANRARNAGVLRSNLSANELVPSAKSQKGVSTPANAAQVDHNTARSKGGPNASGMLAFLSAKENRTKSDN